MVKHWICSNAAGPQGSSSAMGCALLVPSSFKSTAELELLIGLAQSCTPLTAATRKQPEALRSSPADKVTPMASYQMLSCQHMSTTCPHAATIAAITCKEFQKTMSLKQPLRKALFVVIRPHWGNKPKFSSKWSHSFNISPGMERREKVCGCQSIDIYRCNVCHILPLLRPAFGSQSEVHIGRWSSVSSKDSLLMLMHLVARPHPSLPSASAELHECISSQWKSVVGAGHSCLRQEHTGIYRITHTMTHTHIFI